jgi:outer membrane protein
MPNRSPIAGLLCLTLMVWASAAAAQNLKIGVVDLDRLVHESPQAAAAKRHMATKFARRKKILEQKTAALNKAIAQLKAKAPHMSAAAREKLQNDIRDRQRKLQMMQGKYNDDVSAAEQDELDKMRSDLRRVINAYAQKHGYDLILSDSVLYAAARLDITDAILAQLKSNN